MVRGRRQPKDDSRDRPAVVVERPSCAGRPLPTQRPSIPEVPLLALAVVVLGVYWPALSSRAVWVDDAEYVMATQRVGGAGGPSVAGLFTEVLEPSSVRGYYQPLAITSLLMDARAGADLANPRAFHRTNLCLHALNSVLVGVWVFLLLGNPWIAAASGLFFGLHPLTVEPVVWLAERKTLLATLFALGCIIEYVRYARASSWLAYAAALLLFLAGLLAKPTIVPLPLLLLLLDVWPLERFSRRAVLEKVPFLVLSGLSAIITIISQGRTIAVDSPVDHPWGFGPLLVGYNVFFYVGKVVWPRDLASWYAFPHPFSLSNWAVLIHVAGTLALIVVVVRSWRRARPVAIGLLFFVCASLPTLGVMGFHPVIAADRHAYFPMLGLLIPVAWLLSRAVRGGRAGARRGWSVVGVAAVVALCLVETGLTRRYLAVWKDTETLYRHMLARTPEVGALHYGLGVDLQSRGQVDAAVGAYRQALACCGDGRYDRGIARSAHNNIGGLLASRGNVRAAIDHWRASLEIEPNREAVVSNLAWFLSTDRDASIRNGEEAVRLTEGAVAAAGRSGPSVKLLDRLAAAYAEVGRFDDAVATVRRALKHPTARSHARIRAELEARLRRYQDGLPWRD